MEVDPGELLLEPLEPLLLEVENDRISYSVDRLSVGIFRGLTWELTEDDPEEEEEEEESESSEEELDVALAMPTDSTRTTTRMTKNGFMLNARTTQTQERLVSSQ